MNNGNNHKTPPYRLRANRVHSKLKTLCHRWMVTHHPAVVDSFRKKAKREVARG